ncbi:hypothetical protein NHX12_012092, partial [Muraenolepis orangiensis]
MWFAGQGLVVADGEERERRQNNQDQEPPRRRGRGPGEAPGVGRGQVRGQQLLVEVQVIHGVKVLVYGWTAYSELAPTEAGLWYLQHRVLEVISDTGRSTLAGGEEEEEGVSGWQGATSTLNFTLFPLVVVSTEAKSITRA